MRVSVVYASADEQIWLPVEVDDEATLITAIEASGVLALFPTIQLDQQKVGVFGRIAALDAPLCEGDRVEIYRPIVWSDDDDSG